MKALTFYEVVDDWNNSSYGLYSSKKIADTIAMIVEESLSIIGRFSKQVIVRSIELDVVPESYFNLVREKDKAELEEKENEFIEE